MRAALKFLVAASCLTIANSANATTTTLDFISTTAPTYEYASFGPGTYYTKVLYSLINVATNDTVVPSMPVELGDTINGTVTFNQAITTFESLPGFHAEVLVYSDTTGTGIQNWNLDESVRYYLGADEVLPNLLTFGATGGALAIGGSNLLTYQAPFTFDKIIYSLTVTAMYDDSFSPITSGIIPASTAAYRYYAIAAVPEPAAWMTMILGFAATATMMRSRRRRGVMAG